jgi:hypothetical protein
MVTVLEYALHFVVLFIVGHNRGWWSASSARHMAVRITEGPEVADMEDRMYLPIGRQLQLICHRGDHLADSKGLRKPGAELP